MKSTLYLPVAKGLAEGTDERIATADTPTRLENVRFDKRGALLKRHGFSTYASDLETSGNLGSLRYLFSTGVELCALDDHTLYAYSDQLSRWVDRGPVSPGCGLIRPVFRDERSYDEADAAALGGYVIRVGRRQWRAAGSTTDTHEIALGVGEADGSRLTPVLDQGYDAASSTGSIPHAVRATSVGTKLVALWLEGVNGAARDLRGSTWETSGATAATIPTAPIDVVSADCWAQPFGVRTYDAVAADDGSGPMVLAYIRDASRNLRMQLMTGLSSVIATQDLMAADHGQFSRVALAYDGASGKLFVLAVCANTPDELLVWSFDVSGGTFVADWGPVSVYTSPDAAITLTNIGIAWGVSDDTGAKHLAMVWTARDAAFRQPVAGFNSIAADGTGLGTAYRRWNLITQGRPFWHEGKAFSSCSTAVAVETIDKLASGLYTGAGAWEPVTGGLGNLFECEVLMRWHEEASWVVGAYNIGYAETGSFDHGGAHNVYSPSAGVLRWMTIGTSRSVFGSSKHMCDEYELDTTRTPLAATVERGRACIGGALVTWYDGESTAELGHLTAPIPVTVTEQNRSVSSALPADQYHYVAVWYSWDASGALHRSLPSMTVEKDFTATGTDSVELIARTTPVTNRWMNRNAFVVWHKAVNDVQVRLTRPLEVVENEIILSHDTAATYDENQVTGEEVAELLYTEGGEVENVAPEGARIPVVVGGRLWLGDFARRTRLQFSKPFAPGTASEYAIAPECNEGFGVILPDGERVTGMAALDANLLVLTDAGIYLVDAAGGPDNAGAGPMFELRKVSSDAGCIEARSVVAFQGGVLFQSQGGIYLVDRGFGVQNIGEAIESTLADYPRVTSAVAIPDEGQVRFTVTDDEGISGRVLVFDYRNQAWIVWHLQKAGPADIVPVAACYHQPDPTARGSYVIGEADGSLYAESVGATSDVGGAVSMVVQTGWIQAAQHGGWQRVQNVTAMCAYLSRPRIKLEVETDFDPGGDSQQSYTWQDAQLSTFPRHPDIPCRMKLINQKSYAVRVRLTEDEGAIKLTGFRFDVVAKRGSLKAAAAQRA